MKLIGCSIDVLVVSGAISLAIAPVFSLAQPTDTLSRPTSGLTLTPEQEKRLNEIDPQIDTRTRSALQAILTPTQLMQFEGALASETGISFAALTALNLSPAQQTELMQILLSPQPQPDDVLTPNQIEHMRRSLPFHP